MEASGDSGKIKPGRPKKLNLATPRQVAFEEETDRFLTNLPNIAEFVREAVSEKIERLQQAGQTQNAGAVQFKTE